jgi:flagellar basal-body rod protein FlgC
VYGSLDISTSGMIAQRTRLDVASANLANADTLLDSSGRLNPWQARRVMFAPASRDGSALGVRVAKIEVDRSPSTPGEFDPSSPYAFKDGPLAGYVARTNVDSVRENVNAIEAVRAYEANVMAAEASKAIFAATLRLIA